VRLAEHHVRAAIVLGDKLRMSVCSFAPSDEQKIYASTARPRRVISSTAAWQPCRIRVTQSQPRSRHASCAMSAVRSRESFTPDCQREPLRIKYPAHLASTAAMHGSSSHAGMMTA
jgi:hypothetical protein